MCWLLLYSQGSPSWNIIHFSLWSFLKRIKYSACRSWSFTKRKWQNFLLFFLFTTFLLWKISSRFMRWFFFSVSRGARKILMQLLKWAKKCVYEYLIFLWNICFVLDESNFAKMWLTKLCFFNKRWKCVRSEKSIGRQWTRRSLKS